MAEDGDAQGPHRVRYASHQGHLWASHHQIRAVRGAPGGDSSRDLQIKRHAGPQFRQGVSAWRRNQFHREWAKP